MVKTETLYLRNTSNEKYHIINSIPPEMSILSSYSIYNLHKNLFIIVICR